MTIHKTVLLEEAVAMLNLKEGAVVVDATLGGGGHSRKILEQIGNKGKLIAFDRDQEALKRFANLTKEKTNVILVHANFAELENELAKLGIAKVDAILADFGISSDQLDTPGRGMSFLREGKLDMRMDQSRGITAAEIVNGYAEKELGEILREYGEEKYVRQIARAIVKARTAQPLETTLQLAKLIEKSVPAKYAHGRIHAATRTFQALRMEVNRELESISTFLVQAVDVLEKGGKLAIIAFHSGEDVLVKKIFQANARGCICPPQLPICVCGHMPRVKIINKKPVLPSAEEVDENPRARSAKLRVIEKI